MILNLLFRIITFIFISFIGGFFFIAGVKYGIIKLNIGITREKEEGD